jgi:hypothetical protein
LYTPETLWPGGATRRAFDPIGRIRPMKRRGWVLVGVGVLAVLFVVGLVVQAVSRQVARRRERRRVVAACDVDTAANSIFVTLVASGPSGAADAADTNASAFANATCPLRVFVGVCEFYNGAEGDAPTAVALYDARARAPLTSSTPFRLGDHVRTLRIPAAEARGAFAARSQLERFLYRNEAYVLSVACPARFARGWDAALIAALAALPASGTAVLTAPLLPPDGATTTTTAATSPSIHNPGTFTATDDPPPRSALGVHRLPHSRGAPMRSLAAPSGAGAGAGAAFDVASVPATAWAADLSFSRGARVERVPYPRDGIAGVHADSLEDLYMTTALLSAGWTLWHPAVQVAARVAPVEEAVTEPLDVQQGPAEWAATVAATTALVGAIRRMVGFPAVMNRMGVDADGSVSARGRMGLTPTASPDEKDAKVGSTDAYLSVLSRMELAGLRGAG